MKKPETGPTLDNMLRESAAAKMQSGGLMKIDEVAALLDVGAATIHKMPLSSIRIGRALRFDPVDVGHLIAACKEPAVPRSNMWGMMGAQS